MKKKVGELDLNNQVEFVGFIPYGQTTGYYKKTDRFDTAMQSFVYSNITEKFFTGFTTVQYKDKIINFAKPYKAIFDLFYYAKIASLAETREYVYSSRINWEYLNQGGKIQLKKLLITSNLQKMQRVLQTLQADKLI